MDLAPIALAVARQLRRFDLREQERLVAEWIVELTFAAGRPSVRIPRLAWIENLTGIDRADISRAIRALVAMRILATDETQDGMRYRILPDANFWQARPRLSIEELDLALEAIAQNNRQKDLLAPDPTLSDAIAETSLEAASSVQMSKNHPLGNSQHPTIGKFPTLGNSQHQAEFAKPSPPTDNNLAPSSLRHLMLKEFSVKRFNCSSAFKQLNTKEGSTEGSPAVGKFPTPTTAAELERLATCKELFGENSMVNWGGLWRKRIRANPGKVDRVLAALAMDIREGKPINSPGGYANDLWNRFAD